MIDTNDEFVCTSCGCVRTKEVIESREVREPQAIDYTNYSLGSYLGPLEYGHEEKFSTFFSKTSSTFKYLKTMSDYSHGGGSIYKCAKTIERICEKLFIPKVVIGQSVSIAKSVLETKRYRGEYTTAAISAFSIITACKLYGVASIGVREVMEAHRALGNKVKLSTIIAMSMDSPFKAQARRAEEYLSRVIAHIPPNELVKIRIREICLNETSYRHSLLETARKILAMVDDSMRGGHNPCALAATSVYAAEVVLSTIDSRKRCMTQREVAECVDTAEYTIREQYGEIFRPRMDEITYRIRTETIQNQIRPIQNFPTHPERTPVLM